MPALPASAAAARIDTAPQNRHASRASARRILRRVPSDRGPTLRRIDPQEEVPALAGPREAHELLLIEEADAWFEYLEATRGQTALRYREVEPWAWARLSQRLRAIKTRRAKLRPAAAA
jgi:hypothetical protein